MWGGYARQEFGSLGIAEYVADLLKDGGIELKHKSEFKTIKMPNIGEGFQRPYQNAELIAENGDYGTIVCHCERVTLGELKNAIQSDIPATSLDALRRRTRAMQGRCQGFNCLANLNVILREDGYRSRTTKKSTSLRSSRPFSQSDKLTADVLIVGGGPTELAAGLELKKLGVKNVLVAERENEPGGIPRMCGHIGFGLRDFSRVMTGPNYAYKYRELAEQAELKVTPVQRSQVGKVSVKFPIRVLRELEASQRNPFYWRPGSVNGRGRRGWCPAIVRRESLLPDRCSDLSLNSTCR